MSCALRASLTASLKANPKCIWGVSNIFWFPAASPKGPLHLVRLNTMFGTRGHPLWTTGTRWIQREARQKVAARRRIGRLTMAMRRRWRRRCQIKRQGPEEDGGATSEHQQRRIQQRLLVGVAQFPPTHRKQIEVPTILNQQLS
jgi:hypothetical protein